MTYYYDAESKQETKSGSLAQKRVRSQKSTVKFMASVFMARTDANGIFWWIIFKMVKQSNMYITANFWFN